MAPKSNEDGGKVKKNNDTQSLVSVNAAGNLEDEQSSDEENEKEILMMEEDVSEYHIPQVGRWRLPWRSNNANKDGKLIKDSKKEVDGASPKLNPFRFADKRDILLMSLGTLCMMAMGAAIPLNLLLTGKIMTQFVALDSQRFGNVTTFPECDKKNSHVNVESPTSEQVMLSVTTQFIPLCVGLGLAALILAYLGITFWRWTGERQIQRIRVAYFKALMRQSVGWFDVHNTGELNSRMINDVDRLQDVFGDKMAIFIQSMSSFIGSFLLSFLTSWKLAGTVLAVCPLTAFVVGAVGRVCKSLVKRENTAYAKAGAVAEETFSSIRTVAAFGGEKKAEKKYSSNLHKAFKQGVQKAAAFGLSSGLFWFFKFSLNGLALWYGAKLAHKECLQFGDIVVVMVCLSYGSQSLGWAAPMLIGFRMVKTSANLLFKTIDAPVAIDSWSEEGIKPEALEGNIEFINVKFSYPARHEAQVLNELNLTVRKGETIALVGESGCGKSTTIQLIQRFYECDEGRIMIDGKDLRDYNLTWIRNYMGIVSQEPVLFATTIGENIRLGSKYGDEVTQEQIETAAKQANCYDFVMQLPKQFDTLVGERGVQLSGGQKQRIAIARALVRNPAILLLDEATSALDTQSEAIVQDALDKASKGRTTLVIAHRLSTVKGADKIYAFKDGQVYEEGTHDQLMSKEGLYHSLVMRQLQQEDDGKGPDLKQENHHTAKLESASHQTSVSGTTKIDNEYTEVTDRTSMLDANAIGADNESETGSETLPEANIKPSEVFAMNKPEWHIILFGVLSSIVAGSIQPCYAMLMGVVADTFIQSPSKETYRLRSDVISHVVALGAAAAAAYFLQNLLFGVSGERLTKRLRQMCFNSVLHQDIAYFDDEENAVGALTSRLAMEAPLVKGATGIRIGLMAQAMTTLLGILLISFASMWELALALMLFMPVVALSGKIRQKTLEGASKRDRKTIAEGGKIAQEAISGIRTVTSLNQQRYFTTKYFDHFEQLYQANKKGVFVYGIAYAVSQSVISFFNVIIFGIGGYISVCDCASWRAEVVPFTSIIRIYTVALFGSTSIGQTLSQIPDYQKAMMAACSIRDLLLRKPSTDSASLDGVTPASCEGKVSLTDVKFHYPTRPSIKVLQGVSFTVKKGETLALVGSSGCGKSTSVSLLERFYDCTDGAVTIDGRDVKSLNIQWLRHSLGLVSQEPTLFDASIAENIAYGENTREIPMAEIIKAATKANAHNFITSLPDGYETNVGAKGTQLSGGQKQRIAIARALVRNPAVLLLDEATSALDTESEKIVQEALDEALVGRTAIIIAHRLSTIRNANNIGVIDEGKIVEFGTHDQLIEKKGFYYNLVNAQL